MSLYEPVRQCMSRHFNIPAEAITADSSLNELGMDSLALVELVCVVKEELVPGLSAADVTVTPDSTFGQAVRAVEAASAASDAAAAGSPGGTSRTAPA